MKLVHGIILVLLNLCLVVIQNAAEHEMFYCASPDCRDPISLGLTVLQYRKRTDKHLSFPPGQEIRILSKPLSDSGTEWVAWYGGKIGLVPKSMVREQKMIKYDYKYQVPFDSLPFWGTEKPAINEPAHQDYVDTPGVDKAVPVPPVLEIPVNNGNEVVEEAHDDGNNTSVDVDTIEAEANSSKELDSHQEVHFDLPKVVNETEKVDEDASNISVPEASGDVDMSKSAVEEQVSIPKDEEVQTVIDEAVHETQQSEGQDHVTATTQDPAVDQNSETQEDIALGSTNLNEEEMKPKVFEAEVLDNTVSDSDDYVSGLAHDSNSSSNDTPLEGMKVEVKTSQSEESVVSSVRDSEGIEEIGSNSVGDESRPVEQNLEHLKPEVISYMDDSVETEQSAERIGETFRDPVGGHVPQGEIEDRKPVQDSWEELYNSSENSQMKDESHQNPSDSEGDVVHEQAAAPEAIELKVDSAAPPSSETKEEHPTNQHTLDSMNEPIVADAEAQKSEAPDAVKEEKDHANNGPANNENESESVASIFESISGLMGGNDDNAPQDDSKGEPVGKESEAEHGTNAVHTKPGDGILPQADIPPFTGTVGDSSSYEATTDDPVPKVSTPVLPDEAVLLPSDVPNIIASVNSDSIAPEHVQSSGGEHVDPETSYQDHSVDSVADVTPPFVDATVTPSPQIVSSDLDPTVRGTDAEIASQPTSDSPADILDGESTQNQDFQKTADVSNSFQSPEFYYENPVEPDRAKNQDDVLTTTAMYSEPPEAIEPSTEPLPTTPIVDINNNEEATKSEILPDILSDLSPIKNEVNEPESSIPATDDHEKVSEHQQDHHGHEHTHDHHHHHHHNKPRDDSDSMAILVVVKHLSSTLLSFLPEHLQDTILDVDDALVFTGIIALTLISICVPYFIIESIMAVKPLKKQVVELNKNLWKVSAAYENQQEEFDAYKKKALAYDADQKRIEQLEMELQVLKELEGKHKSQVKYLQKQLKASGRAAEGIEGLIESAIQEKDIAITERNNFKSTCATLQATLNTKLEELEQAEAHAGSLVLDLEVMTHEKDNLAKRLSGLETEHDLLKQKLTSECELKRTKEAECERLNLDMEKKEAEMVDLRRILHQYEDNVSSLNEELMSKENELAALKETLGDDSPLIDIAEAKARLKSAEEEASSLKSRVESLTLENQALTKQLEEIKTDYVKVKSSKEEAENNLKVLEGWFKKKEDELRAAVAKLELEQSIKHKDKDDLVKMIRAKESEVQLLISTNEALKSEIDDMKAAHRNEVRTLEAKADEHWLSLCQSERRTQDARKEAEQLRQKLVALVKEKQNGEENEFAANGDMGLFASLPPEMVPPPVDEFVPPSYFPLDMDFIPPPLPLGSEPMRPPPLGRMSPTAANTGYGYMDDDLSPITRGNDGRGDYSGGSSRSDSPLDHRRPGSRDNWMNDNRTDHLRASQRGRRGQGQPGGGPKTSSPIPPGMNL